MASYQVGVIMIGSLNLIEFFVGMGFFEQAAGHGDRNGLVELTVDKQQVIEAMKRDLRFVRNLAKSEA